MNLTKLAGKFVVLDGPDGSGKSTQLKLLAGVISQDGPAVRQLRDPGGTKIGDSVRAILLDANKTTGTAHHSDTSPYMSRDRLESQRRYRAEGLYSYFSDRGAGCD